MVPFICQSARRIQDKSVDYESFWSETACVNVFLKDGVEVPVMNFAHEMSRTKTYTMSTEGVDQDEGYKPESAFRARTRTMTEVSRESPDTDHHELALSEYSFACSQTKTAVKREQPDH